MGDLSGAGRFLLISGLVIAAMARVGLAWEVVEVSPARQKAKTARTVTTPV